LRVEPKRHKKSSNQQPGSIFQSRAAPLKNGYSDLRQTQAESEPTRPVK